MRALKLPAASPGPASTAAEAYTGEGNGEALGRTGRTSVLGSRRVDSVKPLVLSRLFELTGFPIFGLDSLLVALRLFLLGASAEAELPMIFWVKSTATKAGGPLGSLDGLLRFHNRCFHQILARKI